MLGSVGFELGIGVSPDILIHVLQTVPSLAGCVGV